MVSTKAEQGLSLIKPHFTNTAKDSSELTSIREDAHQWPLHREAGWDTEPLLRLRVARMKKRLSGLSELSLATIAKDIFFFLQKLHTGECKLRGKQ